MIRLEGRVMVARSPQEVSGFLADVANDPKWQKDIVHVKLIEGAPGKKGAKYERVQVVAGRNIKTVNELVEVSPSRVAFRAAGKVIEYLLEYALSGKASMTDVTMKMEGEMLGFASMFEGMAAEELGKAVPEDMKRLAGILDRMA